MFGRTSVLGVVWQKNLRLYSVMEYFLCKIGGKHNETRISVQISECRYAQGV